MADTRRQALEKAVYESALKAITATNADYEIMLHYHDYQTPLPITQYVTSIQKNATTDYPYEQMAMTLAINHDIAHQLFSDYSGRPTTGQWISIKRPNKIFNKQGSQNDDLPASIDFIGYITNVSFAMTVNQQNALLTTSQIQITASSFIYPLQVAQYKLHAGTVFDQSITSILNAASEEYAQRTNPDFQTNVETQSFFLSGRDYDTFTDEVDKISLEAKSVRASMKLFIDNLGYTRIPSSLAKDFSTAKFIKEQGFTVAIDPNTKEIINFGIDGRPNIETRPEPVLHDGTDELRIGNFIQVATADFHLPPSSHLRETMPGLDPVVNNLNAIQNTFARGGSVWDLLKSTYQSSEMLFDFYFTWVPFTKADLKAGYKLPNAACLHWGAIPFVIYRLKTLNPGLVPTQLGINKELNVYDEILKPDFKYKKLEYETEIEKAGTFGPLAEAIYTNEEVPIPLRPNLVLAFPLSSNEIISMTYNLSDAYRINSTYVEDPAVQRTTQVTAGAFSTPVIDPEDAQNHGLRMIEAPYPFASLDNPKTEAFSERLYLAQGQGNRFYGGNIVLPYPKTKQINPGTWLSIIFPHRSKDAFAQPSDLKRERIFYCYVKSIDHSLKVNQGNALIQEQTSITYVRGSWGNIAPVLPPTQSGRVIQNQPTGGR